MLTDIGAHLQLTAMLLLAVAMAEVDHQLLRQIEFPQRLAGGGDVLGVIVRPFAAAHNDMPERVAAGLVNRHLPLLVRGEEHMAGAGGADGVHRDARIAVGAVFKSNRAGER